MAMKFSVEAEDKGTAASFKLFGSSIPFFGHSQGSQLFIDQGRRSSKKDVAASMAGICSQSPLYVPGGGKVSKEVVEEESPEGATICINNNGNRELLEEPKKPHLPCPRCKSLNTKFCYFNNYSIKQPRHFCKKCQRYWTAGGTQRNVPVGSGQRKSKNYSSSASYHHPHCFLKPTDNLSVTPDALDSAQHSPVSSTSVMTTCLKTGSSSLSSFGTPKPTFIPSNQESPFYQILPANGTIKQSVAGQECSNGSCETYASNELQRPPPPPLINELAYSSSVSAQSFSLKDAQASKQPTKGEPFASAELMDRSCFSFLTGPRPNGYGLFGWNNNGGVISPSDLSSPWCVNGHLMIAPPAMASATSSCGTDNPVLGKHPREGLPIAVVNDGCLLTPKMLRIRDVEEATQSSIQSPMGLDNNIPK